MKVRSAWSFFHISLILFCILKNIWCIKMIFEIMSQNGPKLDLKIKVGLSDLYFIIQWFCCIIWRLLDVWKRYLGKMSQYNPTYDRITKVSQIDPYFMIYEFCIVTSRLDDMYEHEIMGSRLNTTNVWPQNKNRHSNLYFYWFYVFYTLRNGAGRGFPALRSTCSNKN